jgi:hypothetical protein
VASEVSSLDSRTTSSTLRRASSRYSGDPWDEDRERSPSCAPKAWGGFCGCVQTFLVERIDFEDVFIRNAFRLYREEALRNDSMARQWLGMYVAKGKGEKEKRSGDERGKSARRVVPLCHVGRRTMHMGLAIRRGARHHTQFHTLTHFVPSSPQVRSDRVRLHVAAVAWYLVARPVRDGSESNSSAGMGPCVLYSPDCTRWRYVGYSPGALRRLHKGGRHDHTPPTAASPDHHGSCLLGVNRGR